MAGHSKFANIKHRKGRVDAKRAKTFSKLAKLITVAAKMGGGDADSNPRLRLALDKARMENMPKDNVQRAIKKGTGEGGGGNYEEILYEGYGPGGVAVMAEALTDNRNRTAPELRKVFEKSGGKLGETNSVAYLFERKGIFLVDPETKMDEDQLTEIVLEVGAEDLVGGPGAFEIRSAASDHPQVQQALEAAGVPLVSSEVGHVPANQVSIEDVAEARKVIQLLEDLDDHDDIQAVYANQDIPDSVAQQLGDEG